MEYFFDVDPGEGNGTDVPVPSNTESVSVNVPFVSVANLSQGSHLFFLRAQDDTGTWGPARQARVEMLSAGLNVDPVHIDRAEYFVDQDPGPGNGTEIQAPVDGVFDELQEDVSVGGIDLSSLSLGSHTLFVRMRSSDGVWGPARSSGSNVPSPSPFNFAVSGAPSVTSLEYFFDSDPGAGSGIPLPVPAVSDSVFHAAAKHLSTDLLPLGPHTLYLRARDGDGRWGPAHQKAFEIISTDKTISGLEYFVDIDPGPGNGSPLSPMDGAFDEGGEQGNEALLTTNLVEGPHQIAVRAQSSDGVWSNAVAKVFTVTEPSDPTPPTTPVVIDGGVYTTDASGLSASWQSEDPESGIAQYEYSIGTSAGALDVMGWTSIGTATSGTLTGGVFVSQTTYYINIRATNGDGLVSAVGSSNGITFLNPLEDPDGDGFNNQSEVSAKSDPFNADSRPGSTTLALRPGFNLISVPAETLYFETLGNLLEALGGSAAVAQMQLLDPVQQTFDEVGYDQFGQFFGSNAGLAGGQGVPGAIVYATQELQVPFSSIYCHTWNLRIGANLVGTPCATGVTAFQVLQAIGINTVVSSIQRFNFATGRFETATYTSNGQPTGVNFPMVGGEGFIVTMKQERLGFRP